MARSTVAYHVDRLRDHDVVRKERADGRVTVAVTRPAAVARLLDAAEPTAPGRFVDRFERLLDDLL